MKHYFAIRMMHMDSGRPMRKLFSYSTESQQLTIDDFVKINSADPQYELICYFYVGYGDESILNKYSDIIGWNL